MDTSPSFKTLLTSDTRLFLQYRSLNALVPKVNGIQKSEFNHSVDPRILDLLSPQKCTAIVDFALAAKEHTYRASMTTWLASGLKHLVDVSVRNTLVDAILIGHEKIDLQPQIVSFEGEDLIPPSNALGQLCKWFPHLDTVQRQRVIDAVHALPDGELKASLIGDLGESMSSMDSAQSTPVVKDFLQLSGEFKHLALPGLATAIAQGHIQKHRDLLVNDIARIENPLDQARAIGAFGPALSLFVDNANPVSFSILA
jgi:hypothetical protein